MFNSSIVRLRYPVNCSAGRLVAMRLAYGDGLRRVSLLTRWSCSSTATCKHLERLEGFKMGHSQLINICKGERDFDFRLGNPLDIKDCPY